MENIQLYPNPANTSVTISLKSLKGENTSISIIDMLGREIKSTTYQNLQAENNKIKLDITELNNGIYFICINNTKSFIRKLVVEK